MDVSGKVVLFRLTDEGQNALRGLVPGGDSIRTLVLGTDSVGAWILMDWVMKQDSEEKVPMMVLKWDYIATAEFEYSPEEPVPQKNMGF